MIRYNIYVTPPGTPKPERTLLFHEDLERRALIRRERHRNLLHRHLEGESTRRVELEFRKPSLSDEVVVPSERQPTAREEGRLDIPSSSC